MSEMPPPSSSWSAPAIPFADDCYPQGLHRSLEYYTRQAHPRFEMHFRKEDKGKSAIGKLPPPANNTNRPGDSSRKHHALSSKPSGGKRPQLYIKRPRTAESQTKTEDRPNTFTDLPVEIVTIIYGYATPAATNALRHSCSKFFQIYEYDKSRLPLTLTISSNPASIRRAKIVGAREGHRVETIIFEDLIPITPAKLARRYPRLTPVALDAYRRHWASLATTHHSAIDAEDYAMGEDGRDGFKFWMQLFPNLKKVELLSGFLEKRASTSNLTPLEELLYPAGLLDLHGGRLWDDRSSGRIFRAPTIVDELWNECTALWFQGLVKAAMKIREYHNAWAQAMSQQLQLCKRRLPGLCVVADTICTELIPLPGGPQQWYLSEAIRKIDLTYHDPLNLCNPSRDVSLLHARRVSYNPTSKRISKRGECKFITLTCPDTNTSDIGTHHAALYALLPTSRADEKKEGPEKDSEEDSEEDLGDSEGDSEADFDEYMIEESDDDMESEPDADLSWLTSTA
ncbi:hypothetical protein M011DRAFT_461238 [Sporormia fimetaria CBS 119925]|uniref:F-box domain-containing protein n=1 Tax=Sporormia fimetaria CBS 119925 TaxID=1340428 RepID=A0A6A6V251_9PLEO|nr:hypothetical protein M011DRAFT_461238 [Sporormia fimetaria CBS 119925]